MSSYKSGSSRGTKKSIRSRGSVKINVPRSQLSRSWPSSLASTGSGYRIRPRQMRSTLGTKMYGKSPFPPSMFVKQSYTETTGLTTGAAGIFGTEVVYQLNNQFDPQLAVGGHQPYGRDTLATLYRNYKVVGCKVVVQFVDPNTDGTACACLWQNSGETSTLTSLDYDASKEKSNCSQVYLNTTGSQIRTISKYIAIQKIEGITKTQFAGDMTEYSSVATTGPSRTPFVRIAIANINGTAGATCRAVATLTMYTRWFNRVQLGQS